MTLGAHSKIIKKYKKSFFSKLLTQPPSSHEANHLTQPPSSHEANQLRQFSQRNRFIEGISSFWEALKLFIVICVFACNYLKKLVIFGNFEFFSQYLDKSNFWLILKTYFSKEISQNLSTYSDQKYFQIKYTNLAIIASGNSVKYFLNLLKILRGKLPLGAPSG